MNEKTLNKKIDILCDENRQLRQQLANLKDVTDLNYYKGKAEAYSHMINESGYQDGSLGAGYPAKEYRQQRLDQIRTVVANEMLQEREASK